MIAIVDYGVGNLFSLCSSLAHLGLQAQVTASAGALAAADRVILPGVGAFGDAAARLRESGLWQPVCDAAAAGKPLLGICLGMQLLFETSDEFGRHEGLGLIPGRVTGLQGRLPGGLKVPHMGWNRLQLLRPQDPFFKYTKEGEFFYYVHSFSAVDCEESTLAVSEYGLPVTGVVRRGSVIGTQFHPEKSGSAGLGLLKAFSEL